MNIGKKISDRRKELQLTMFEVARRTGVSEATVSRWESGDIANMRRDKIVALSEALQVSPIFLMDWDVTSDCENAKATKEEELVAIFKFLDEDSQDKVLKFAKTVQQKRPTLIVENEPRYLVRRAGRDGSYTEEYLTKEELDKEIEKKRSLPDATDL